MTKDVSQLRAGLGSHELADLAELCHRAKPCVSVTMARLEADGLVEFVREDREGRTWFRATPLGRAVNRYVEGPV